ncbi:MAG TPA: response regulator transcription factor, partial [bacterium]|nr:response regulator transcription factor [bacterium]
MSLLKKQLSTKKKPKKRILLVDEFPIVRGGLTELFKRTEDLQVCAEAESPAQVLALVRRTKPDLVILELLLRGSAGFALIEEIRGNHPDLPILVFTSEREFFLARRALDAGAEGYLHKREGAPAILEAVRSLLEGKIYVSPLLTESPASQVVPLGGQKGIRGIQKMSNRELQIFQLLGEGQNTREMAMNLGLSVKTVETYCARLKTKLNIRNVNELLRSATFWIAKHGGV